MNRKLTTVEWMSYATQKERRRCVGQVLNIIALARLQRWDTHVIERLERLATDMEHVVADTQESEE